MMALITVAVSANAQLRDASNSERFAEQKSGLFIVKTVDRTSNAKVSVGSGFLVDADRGLIATNYHVVSEQILRPDRYALQFETIDGAEGPLTIVDVDVVNDLAIVQPPSDDTAALPADTWMFELAGIAPPQGDEIIAMGNPYDIGISMVPGVYNGLTRKGFKKSIHFTGALNPGMSGGPAVDLDGRVVGVNVAGAGNSVSFLVPVELLATLLTRAQSVDPERYELKASILADLSNYQERLIDDLLSGDWSLTPFGPIEIPHEVRDYVDCTGSAAPRDPEQRFDRYASDCGVDDVIYLSQTFETGTIELDYGWYVSEQLDLFPFYDVMEAATFSPMNRASREDVSDFKCAEDITRLPNTDDKDWKAVTCARAYLDYEGLYDIVYYAKSILDRTEGVYLHYTLAGVTQASAQRFFDQFTEAVSWP